MARGAPEREDGRALTELCASFFPEGDPDVYSVPGMRGLFVALGRNSGFAVRSSIASRKRAWLGREREAGFKSMFNGKDFTGWRFSGGKDDGARDAANWKVKDGVIHLSGGGQPHLATQREYADFELRFEWRALRDRYNSGLFIRSGSDKLPEAFNCSKRNGTRGDIDNRRCICSRDRRPQPTHDRDDRQSGPAFGSAFEWRRSNLKSS